MQALHVVAVVPLVCRVWCTFTLFNNQVRRIPSDIKKPGSLINYQVFLLTFKYYLVSANLPFDVFFTSLDLMRAMPKGLSFANSIRIGAATKIDE